MQSRMISPDRLSAHRDHARAWGIDPGVFGDVPVDISHATIPEKLRPVLTFAGKLTLDPAAVNEVDANGIYEAGYSEAGLFDIISVTSLYNFMNRVLEGAGIKQHVRVMELTDEMRRKYRYTHLWKVISPDMTGR